MTKPVYEYSNIINMFGEFEEVKNKEGNLRLVPAKNSLVAFIALDGKSRVLIPSNNVKEIVPRSWKSVGNPGEGRVYLECFDSKGEMFEGDLRIERGVVQIRREIPYFRKEIFFSDIEAIEEDRVGYLTVYLR